MCDDHRPSVAIPAVQVDRAPRFVPSWYAAASLAFRALVTTMDPCPVKGFYVSWTNDPPNAKIKDWNVTELKVCILLSMLPLSSY